MTAESGIKAAFESWAFNHPKLAPNDANGWFLYSNPAADVALDAYRAGRAVAVNAEAVPLIVCSETIRKAILRGDRWAAGLASGLASLAKAEGIALAAAPPAESAQPALEADDAQALLALANRIVEAGDKPIEISIDAARIIRSLVWNAQPAQQSEPVGEVILLGGDSDLKQVAWRKGKMPQPGTKLYADPQQVQQIEHVPNGCRLVPIEPIEAMLDAACDKAVHVCEQGDSWYEVRPLSEADARAVWSAMLRAAPQPAQQIELTGDLWMPTYGKLPFSQLGMDVNESITGQRSPFDFGSYYPGHAPVNMNMNSLARIVDKYRLAAPQAAQAAPVDAPPPSKDRIDLCYIIHDMVVAQQAAWIEWKHGEGAEAAMRWIHNGLCGPGNIPDEDAPYGKEPQAYFDANKSDPFPPCTCGRPSNTLWMGQGFCCDEHYRQAKALAASEQGKAVSADQAPTKSEHGQGMQAYDDGKPKSANPYDARLKSGKEWGRGWESARLMSDGNKQGGNHGE